LIATFEKPGFSGLVENGARCEYINEHLHQDVKLIELAAIAQMSPYPDGVTTPPETMPQGN